MQFKTLTRVIDEQDDNKGKRVRDMNIQKDDPQLIELQDLKTSLLEEVRLYSLHDATIATKCGSPLQIIFLNLTFR